jgi:hypothetical protein
MEGAGEQRPGAGAVIGCIGIAPEIRAPAKALDRTGGVTVCEQQRALGGVRRGADRGARERVRESGELGHRRSRRREVLAGECDLDLDDLCEGQWS